MFDIRNEFEKSKSIEFEISLKAGKKVQEIIAEFVELIIDKIKIPTTMEGSNLLKFLINSRVIQNINVKEYLEINDHVLTVDELSILYNLFDVEIVGPHEMLMVIRVPDISSIKEFEYSNGCRVVTDKGGFGDD